MCLSASIHVSVYMLALASMFVLKLNDYVLVLVRTTFDTTLFSRVDGVLRHHGEGGV